MPGERVEFGVTRTQCTCRACVINCEYIPGYLIPSDLERMIPPGVDPEAWAREHLRASPGAKILRWHPDGRQQLIQVGTLVPAHVPTGLACHWLKDGRCTIHAVAPFGCAFFDCQQTQEHGDALSSRGINAIMESHRDGSLYSRLWTILWDAELRAPAAEEKRAAMAAAWRRRRKAPQLPPRRRH